MTPETLIAKVARIIKREGFGMLFLKGWRAILRKLEPIRLVFYPYAKWRVPREANQSHTAESAVSFALTKVGGFIRPTQVVWEIMSLAKIVEELRPKTILEIGTSKGGTLFVFSRLATPDALITSIDLPGGENNWAYPRWKEPFYRTFAAKGQAIELLRGDSHNPETLARLKKILGERQIDFLFIDGDHAYEGVKQDYLLYAPLVRVGGVIAFHDVAKHPPITGCEVERFWSEVKEGKNAKEFIENENQGWGGIGVLFV